MTLTYHFRAFLCEWMIGRALKIAPEGYAPSAVEVAANGYLAGRAGQPFPDYKSQNVPDVGALYARHQK